MWALLLIIPAALIVLLAVIIIRALCFKPKAGAKVNDGEEVFDKDKTVEALRSLIRCKTVSYRDA